MLVVWNLDVQSRLLMRGHAFTQYAAAHGRRFGSNRCEVLRPKIGFGVIGAAVFVWSAMHDWNDGEVAVSERRRSRRRVFERRRLPRIRSDLLPPDHAAEEVEDERHLEREERP